MTGAAVDPAPAAVSTRVAVWLFLSFAFAYFFSALLRGVTATLAPSFSAELGLSAGDLGLLSGAFFFGFALTQLPLGSALDRYGVRRVSIVFLLVAVLGCAAFGLARSFAGLTFARALIGIGVSASLMAPLTAFRHRYTPVMQMRATSWILMTGSFGMVASTLPVQWLLPLIGWRGLFWVLAGALAIAALAIARCVPRDAAAAEAAVLQPQPQWGAGPMLRQRPGYREIFRHPTFQRFVPFGSIHYGGLIAVQSLWAGPWLVEVSGLQPRAAARGLFEINVSMLLAFMAWGLVVPRLYARGWAAQSLIAWGAPLSIAALVFALLLGPAASAWHWAFFCVASTFGALAQPAIGLAFAGRLAGRALSAYNLIVFAGVFVLQWGLGVAIDAFRRAGWDTVSAYRGAFALMAVCYVLSYLWFLWRDDRALQPILNPNRRTVDNPPPCPD